MKTLHTFGPLGFPGWAMLIIALFTGAGLAAKPPVHEGNGSIHHPPRIIRSCCAFGTDLRLGPLPMIRKTDIIAPDDLGRHRYLGGDTEGNGIIYTTSGGFIDVAHLRDLADWTGYLFNLITSRDSLEDGTVLDLGSEGGAKTLTLHVPPGLDRATTAELAALIAYDVSVWHEIASWYEGSYLAFIPERYSSFSPEDLYSNLLGTQLGVRAILSDQEYSEAMTGLIARTLDSLGAVRTMSDTYQAMNKVEGIWWSREKPLPSGKILICRYLSNDQRLVPWRLDEDQDRYPVHPLDKPARVLDTYFDLDITVHRMFYRQASDCLRNRRTVDQRDFNAIIRCISGQTDNLTVEYPKPGD